MKIILSILIALFLCSSSCEKLVDHVYSIKIQNNSEGAISFYVSINYPDTSIVSEKPQLKIAYPSKYTYWDSKENWDDIVPSDTIAVYIFSKNTVDLYSWEEIKNDNMILKRYDLSIKDLEKQSWTVTYP